MLSRVVRFVKECGLLKLLSVKFLIVLLATLAFDVVANSFFATMRSHSGNEVTIRPKLSAPEFLFDVRTARKYLTGRNALDSANDFGGAVSWH